MSECLGFAATMVNKKDCGTQTFRSREVDSDFVTDNIAQPFIV
jgi:hypothetical protein